MRHTCRAITSALLFVAVSAPIARAAQATRSTPSSSAQIVQPLIDLNTASRDDLLMLPGIGRSDATKIIAGRPYKLKDDLTLKHVISPGTYNKIKSLVTARPSTK